MDGAVVGLSHLVGDVAHIVAEEDDGPRGKSPLTLEERNAEPNLLLICKPEHKKIDDDPSTHPVELLKATKLAHEKWVKSSLSASVIWETKLFQLDYINVPRLSVLAALLGVEIKPFRFEPSKALHELGLEINAVLLRFERVLQAVEVKAIPLEVAVTMQDRRGMLVSFNREFRTKNILMPRPGQSFETVFTGDQRKDAHIYAKLDNWKVVANIDRKWITGTTAFGDFRPSSGHHRFAGLGFIKSADMRTKIINITPYVIGFPSNPAIEALYRWR